MKLLICLVASAAATAPPRIELDLASWKDKMSTNMLYSAGDGSPVTGGEVPAATHGRRHDWSARCPAGPNTSIETCPFPVARAYDHQDEDITSRIQTRVYLVNREQVHCPDASCGCASSDTNHCEVDKVSFSYRAKYVFLYDVTDKAGNRAEQVVYMLELDDTTRPDIRVCGGTTEGQADIWEAATGGELCATTSTEDNVDADLSANLYYRILDVTNPTNTKVLCQNGVSLPDLSEKGEQQDTSTSGWHKYADYKADPSDVSTCAHYALNNAHGTKDNKVAPLKTIGVGDFAIEYYLCDNAGSYGEFETDNCRTAMQAIEVRDTSKPWIRVHQGDVRVHECNKDSAKNVYAEPASLPDADDVAAIVYDALDTQTLGKKLNFETTGIDAVDQTKIDDYTITYNAQDLNGSCGNDEGPCAADPVTRLVQVRDRTNPVITLTKPGRHVHINAETETEPREFLNYKDAEPGWDCTDSCDTNPKKHTVTFDPALPEKLDVTGIYTATYKCTDQTGNEDVKTREFEIKDKGIPTIQLEGEQVLTIEADLLETYVDETVKCYDVIDKDLTSSVVVGGCEEVADATCVGEQNPRQECLAKGMRGQNCGQDTVNLAQGGPEFMSTNRFPDNSNLGKSLAPKPGQYVIRYDCMDLSGNKANPEFRTIFVQDTTCPKIKLEGASEMTLEAGFKYQDPGFYATDNLDEDVTKSVWTNGDTVGEISTSLEMASCQDIKAADPKANSGEYYITRTTNKNVQTRVLVHCDMTTHDIALTFRKCSGCKTVKPYQTDDSGDCAAWGLQMLTKFGGRRENGDFAYEFDVMPYMCGGAKFDACEQTDMYLCGINDADDQALANSRLAAANVEIQKPQAHAGIYVVEYIVQDTAGNFNYGCGETCDTCCGKGATGSTVASDAMCGNEGQRVKRTVFVRDTLPPVISLHLKGTRIAQSGAAGKGANGQENPAGDTRNKFLTETPGISQADEAAANTNVFNYMAEVSSANSAWAIVGVAAAVAGVALLAVSRKNANVVVEV